MPTTLLFSAQVRERRNSNLRWPLKVEQTIAQRLLVKWRTRNIWQNVSWNRLAWQNHFKTHYDNRDLLIICQRVAARVYRRKLGS